MRNTLTLVSFVLATLVSPPAWPDPTALAPWSNAGWSDREAAAHLLDRLTYGPRPGEIDRVVEQGLHEWVDRELRGERAEPVELHEALERLDALGFSAEKIAEVFPPPGLLVRELRRSGIISEAGPEAGPDEEIGSSDRQAARRKVEDYMKEKGYRRPRELFEQLYSQKLYRAVLSENQLREVLTDFWFNHFNVSIQDDQARTHILAYERDVIRPNVFSTFRGMLGGTAKHPAMLLYLDNARSMADEGRGTTVNVDSYRSRGGPGNQGMRGLGRSGRGGSSFDAGRGFRGESGRQRGNSARQPDAERPPQGVTGLNENYARELLELHTLGVDGGYDQEDVIEVARAFTGWTSFPPGQRAELMQRLGRLPRSARDLFEPQGLFVFAAHRHDAEEKTVLGVLLPAKRGIEDGEEVLDLLAAHSSTARHLARKLAIRFVADEPPPDLVDRLADRFRKTGGDLLQVTRSLVYSPEFWDRRYRTAKIKSPLELSASALRAVAVEIEDPIPTLEWIARMGQPLYAYQAPTGYPDRADFWVNTGTLLHRMNFGLQLASGRIEGLAVDLLAAHSGVEKESLDDALESYLGYLLPERDTSGTSAQLRLLIHDPQLREKIDEASEAPPISLFPDLGSRDDGRFGSSGRAGDRRRKVVTYEAPSELAQVVGVIFGSPAYQRR